MNTKKVIQIQNEIFFEIKNLWNISEQGNKSNLILDNFLDELNIKQNPENRFIAYSRISELRTEPLELYLHNIGKIIDENNKTSRIKIPNKLSDNRIVLDKAYNYVKRIYEDLAEKFIYKLEKEKIISDFEIKIFKGVLSVGKAFNNFMPAWEKAIAKQNDILDKKFEGNSEKIMNFLREKKLLEIDEKGEETDRSYSVIKSGKIVSYIDAFSPQVNSIILALSDFIDDLEETNDEQKHIYINYLEAIKNAFSQKDNTKSLSKWQKVDEAWMDMKGAIQISHPLEFYEDKYRKAVAPEWDLRIIDTETLDSKVEENIKNMYENIYDEIGKNKYAESYNFSKDNFNRVQLCISEPVLYFGKNLNGMFSAQVVPNDEVVSEKFGKKIFAFPKMVLENKKKAPLMKLTKEILDEKLLNDYEEILGNSDLFYQIYDIETIGHEFGHTLFLTKNTEILMNKKTGNFKNIEEFKATAGGLCSYFMNNNVEQEQTQGIAPTKNQNNVGVNLVFAQDNFNKNIVILHLIRCIGLLKYREIAEVLPYYNESLIHLEIMFETSIFEIIPHPNPLLGKEREYKVKLNFNTENFEKLKQNYIFHYKKLINTYLEKLDAGEFLYDYVIIDKSGNNISKNKDLQEFGNYYYDLYGKIGNEVV